jgi:hypothetical protein
VLERGSQQQISYTHTHMLYLLDLTVALRDFLNVMRKT